MRRFPSIRINKPPSGRGFVTSSSMDESDPQVKRPVVSVPLVGLTVEPDAPEELSAVVRPMA